MGMKSNTERRGKEADSQAFCQKHFIDIDAEIHRHKISVFLPEISAFFHVRKY